MTSGQPELAELFDRLRDGHVGSAARAITMLESGSHGADELRELVWSAGGHARVIGITGAPGSGKSTLVGALTAELRRRGRTVAIVAVDPSSAASGGAILGDRIRMCDVAGDNGVFVRSMSNRGWLGGVARATIDAVAVLDVAGWDDVVVETVGVGQAEVGVVAIAQTVVVVSVPGMGDEVQMIKAGLLEIADIHVVNKADRPDAGRAVAELKSMLGLAAPAGPLGWAPPVLETVALAPSGIDGLIEAVEMHTRSAEASGDRLGRWRQGVEARVREIAKELLVDRIRDPAFGADFPGLVARVVSRRMSPHAAARELMAVVPGSPDLTAGGGDPMLMPAGGFWKEGHE